MAISTAGMSADLVAILADLSSTFTIGSTSYACAAGEAAAGYSPEDAGVWPEADLTLLAVPAAAFVLGVALTYSSASYRIERIGKTQDGVGVLLYCRALDKRSGR